MAYMLIGWAPGETFEDIEYRFSAMVKRGILPYPMVFGNNPGLKRFQRWAVRGLYKMVSFSEYSTARKRRRPKSLGQREFL